MGSKDSRKKNGSWKCFKDLCINSAVQNNIRKSDYSYILNSVDAKSGKERFIKRSSNSVLSISLATQQCSSRNVLNLDFFVVSFHCELGQSNF